MNWRVNVEGLLMICNLPLDPVIFDGTVRRNLDPTDQHTDEQLWSVLKRAHLEEAIKYANRPPPRSFVGKATDTEL